MSTLVSKKFGVFSANAFSKSFETDSIYFFIGKPTAWKTPASPDTSSDTVNESKTAWNSMAGTFRITSDKVAQGIKRNDWAVGTKYEKYNSNNSTLGSANGYYVLAGTTNRDVYKCLDNNGDSKSTVKPTQKDLSTYREYDGYVWKYMYTITETDWNKFATESVIPVKTDSAVSGAAVAGSILNIPLYGANTLLGVGRNYRGSNFANGTPGIVLQNANVTSIASAPTVYNVGWKNDDPNLIVADYFNNCAVMFTSGKAKGHISKITDWIWTDGAGGYGQFALDSDEDLLPASVVVGDTVLFGPKVTLMDDVGGSRFTGIAEVNPFGNVTSITVGNIGSGYSNTQFSANISSRWDSLTNDAYTANGIGAYANVYLPPPGGHGYNAFDELDAKYVIVSGTTPKGGDADDALTPDYGMDFQQLGFLRNPIDPLTQEIAIGSSYDLRTHFMFDSTVTTYSTLTSNFPADTNITNANNQAKATVWKVGNQHHEITTLSLVNTEGTFANGQYIQNSAGDQEQIWSVNAYAYTGKIRGKETQNTIAVYTEQLTKYSGEVIYLDNIEAVTRHKDQYETFKVVFEF
jgi:hypothetical protein